MKREGRQHGMVRTYRILSGNLNHTSNRLRFVNRIDTTPAAGQFINVSTKPTNHSKSSGLANSNSKAKNPKRRNINKYKAVFIDDVYLTGASASGVLCSFEDAYNDDQPYGYGDYGSLRGGLDAIEVNDVTDEKCNSEEEVEERVRSLTTKQIDPNVMHHRELIEAAMNEEDEKAADEDGGSVKIGELVVLLADEDEWSFVGADDQF